MQFNRFVNAFVPLKIVILALISALFSASAKARPVGKIRDIRPLVEVRAGQNGAWKPAADRSNMEPGHSIRSGFKGGAALRFSNGTAVVLNAKTQVFIEGDDTPAKPLGLRVFGALSQIVVRSKGTMQIRAAAAIAAPRGTEYMITLTDENTMVLTVAEGSVRFFNAEGEQIVSPNQQSTAKVGEAPTAPVAVDASGLMQWAFDVAALPVEFEMPQATGNLQTGNLQTLRAAANANPNNAAAWRALGETLRQSGDANGAVEAYQKALQLDNSDTSRVGLALAFLARNDVATAGDTLAKNPDSALELAARGLIQLRANDVSGAVQSLKEAAQRDPQLPQAFSLLALAHLTQNQTSEAIVDGRRAVQIAPNSSQAQSALSLALFYAGETREASRSASRAVQLNPESPLALLVQGQALLAAHQTDAARASLQQAEAIAPNLPIVQTNLAAAYTRLDMPQRAEKAYRRVLEKSPDSATAHAGLGGVLLSSGQNAQALTELQRALELEPNNVLARANLALYNIESGDFAAAQTAAQTLGDDAASGLLYIRLSEASLFAQKLFEAQEFARKAVKLLPDSAPAHYQLGRVYREQERSVQAEQEFRQAVILDRQNAAARFALGLAREAAQSGSDFSRPLDAIASNNSGPRQALNIQNLQTPGADDRIQAAIQDPSVVRNASRAFGDNQIEGSYGEDNTNSINLSHLQDINKRRGSFGASLGRDHTDGIRANADLTQENFGIFGGSKKPDAASGFFALAQWRRSRFGSDTGLLPQAAGTALRVEKIIPFTMLGYSYQTSENQRTRLLVAYDAPQNDRMAPNGGFLDTKGRSVHGEVRHDFLIANKHLLSAGASLGTRRFDLDILSVTPPGLMFPDFRGTNAQKLQTTKAYVRDEIQLSPRLTAMAEMKVERVENRVNSVVTSPPNRPPNANQTTTTVGVPNFVATYQINSNSLMRLRARGLFGTVEDFGILSPNDLFLFVRDDVPQLNLGTRGRSYEAELTHTFGNASFLRVAAFQQQMDSAFGFSEDYTDVRFRAIRAQYDGVLNRSTTFFVSANLNDATATLDATGLGGALDTNYQLTRVPKFTTEFGLQFLNQSGWFVQPSVAYIGSRFQETDGTPRAKLSSFGLANLRIGKRAGLRSTLFIEVSNLFNKNYVGSNGFLGELQPGRQVKIGTARRF